METKTLYILRGVSGSGKSTLAITLESELTDAIAIAADDYHYDKEGVYNFDLKNLKKAHEYCKSEVERYITKYHYTNIILHNTNTSENEITPYIDIADRHGYKVVSLVVENRHGSNDVHNVPSEVKVAQENRLRNSLKL